MDYEVLFPGRFIKSADFQGKDVTVTIRSIKAEEIEEKMKAILSFAETKKSMVLNRTNAEALRLMFGRNTDDWIGRRVTFYPAVMKDPFGDGEITAIRVRGSPDITEAKSAVVQRGRKTIKVAVKPTGQAAAPRGANGKTRGAAQTPAPAAAPADTGGEPPPDVPLPTSDGRRVTAAESESDPFESN